MQSSVKLRLYSRDIEDKHCINRSDIKLKNSISYQIIKFFVVKFGIVLKALVSVKNEMKNDISDINMFISFFDVLHEGFKKRS